MEDTAQPHLEETKQNQTKQTLSSPETAEALKGCGKLEIASMLRA